MTAWHVADWIIRVAAAVLLWCAGYREGRHREREAQEARTRP